MSGLLLALAGAFCWAGLDATRKVLVRDVDPTTAAAWLALLSAPAFLAWAVLAPGATPAGGYWVPGGIAMALQVAANVLFFRALHLSPLSLTIPFLSLTPVFTSLVGVVLLGEWPTALQWMGILLVVIGALTLHGDGSLLEALARERGSLLMVLVALIWSVTGNLSKLALEHASVAWHGAIQTGGVGLVLLAYLVARRGPRALRVPGARRRWLLASLAFSVAALAFQFAAIRLILVGLVEALKRGIGMTSSVVLGRLLFAEPITRGKVLAVGLMTAGVALLLL